MSDEEINTLKKMLNGDINDIYLALSIIRSCDDLKSLEYDALRSLHFILSSLLIFINNYYFDDKFKVLSTWQRVELEQAILIINELIETTINEYFQKINTKDGGSDN